MDIEIKYSDRESRVKIKDALNNYHMENAKVFAKDSLGVSVSIGSFEQVFDDKDVKTGDM